MLNLLTKEHQEQYEMQISVTLVKKIQNKYLKDKKYRKVRGHCHYEGEYRAVAHSICKKHFTCLGENTEKYITFTIPIVK